MKEVYINIQCDESDVEEVIMLPPLPSGSDVPLRADELRLDEQQFDSDGTLECLVMLPDSPKAAGSQTGGMVVMEPLPTSDDDSGAEPENPPVVHTCETRAHMISRIRRNGCIAEDATEAERACVAGMWGPLERPASIQYRVPTATNVKIQIVPWDRKPRVRPEPTEEELKWSEESSKRQHREYLRSRYHDSDEGTPITPTPGAQLIAQMKAEWTARDREHFRQQAYRRTAAPGKPSFSAEPRYPVTARRIDSPRPVGKRPAEEQLVPEEELQKRRRVSRNLMAEFDPTHQ